MHSASRARFFVPLLNYAALSAGETLLQFQLSHGTDVRTAGRADVRAGQKLGNGEHCRAGVRMARVRISWVLGLSVFGGTRHRGDPTCV